MYLNELINLKNTLSNKYITPKLTKLITILSLILKKGFVSQTQISLNQ